MKTQIKYIILLLSMTLSPYSYAQLRVSNYTGISTTANSPAFIDASSNPSYNNSTNYGKGLVFPRVDLSTFTFPSIATGVPTNYPTRYDGMIVYNTATTGVAGAGLTQGTLTPGFWYYENKTNSVTGGTWKPLGSSNNSSNDATKVKQLEITLNETIGIQSKTYSGTTAVTSSAIKIVGIEPQLTGDAVMLATMLKVNSLANLNSSATAVNWSVAIENDNINAARNCTLTKVIISYISDDDLTNASSTSQTVAGR